MSQDDRRYNSGNSKKSQKSNHYQKKVADRRRLEAVYKDKVRYSDGGVHESLSVHRGGYSPSSLSQRLNNEQALVTPLTAVDRPSATQQEQYVHQQQQPLIVYLQGDQNSSCQQATFQGLSFDLNQLVVENQDSGYGTTSQTIEPVAESYYEDRMFNANRTDGTSAIGATHQSEYELVVEGPADPTGSSITMYAANPHHQQQQQQQNQQQPYGQTQRHSPPSRYNTPLRTSPVRSSNLSPVRNDLDFLMSSPSSPKSLMSPSPPRSSPVTAMPACDNIVTQPVTQSPRVPCTASYSPYVPVDNTSIAGSSATPVSYVPTPCKNIANTNSMTPRVTSPRVCLPAATETSSPRVALSHGKKISFNDAASARSTDIESDDTDAEDNINGDDDEENNKEEGVSHTKLLKIFRETPASNKENLLKQLNEFGDKYFKKYKSADDLFSINEKRTKLLTSVGKYTDEKNNNRRFEKGFAALFERGTPDLKKLWQGLRQTGGFMDTVNDKIPKSLRWLFVQLALCYTDFTTLTKNECSVLVSASSNMRRTKGKSLETVLRLAVGLNGAVERYLGKRRQTGDEIEESDFTEPPTPSPPKRIKRSCPAPPLYENEEEVESDAAASVVSNKSVRRGTAVASSGKHLSPPPPTPPQPVFSLPENVSIIDFEGIKFRPTNQPIERQGTVCTARPNGHLSSATKSVVLRTIEKREQEITFANIIEVFVKKTTESVFGEAVSNLAEICLKITKINENSEKDAISFCTNLRSLVLTMTQIKFDAVADWCTIYCTALSQVLCRTSDKIGVCERNVLKTRLKEEYSNIVVAVKSVMVEGMQNYNATFQGLARISDWCCYTIFGVSLSDKGDGTVDTLVLIKNILSAWIILEKLPINLNKDEAEKLNKLLWCVPLVQLTNLGGFSVHAEEVKKPIACGLDEYFDTI